MVTKNMETASHQKGSFKAIQNMERDIHGQILNQVQFQNLKIEENPQASD